MFNRFFASLFILCIFSFDAAAVSDNPFAKSESISIGKDIVWDIDKKESVATKSVSDSKGDYYHLLFDNKQLKLAATDDADGNSFKQFSQLEIEEVAIDGVQSSLFKWCLANQERHSRFLQQGLSVKKNVCQIDGNAGTFIINLNKDMLLSLQQGSRLIIRLKPFRTPIELIYDISDFQQMYTALNDRPEAPVAKPVAAVVAPKVDKKCLAGAPAGYENIKPVEYSCSDVTARIKAETSITRLVDQEKVRLQQLSAEKERQLKLAEEKKQKELAEKLKLEEQKRLEAEALAASEAKQAAISGEIAEKMIAMCQKFWDKGEHRCYCQKYIESAPESIKASSTCE